MKHLVLFLAVISFSASAFSQVRKIPAAVTTAFTKQYPNAQDVAYRDQLTGYRVDFTLDSNKMTARYDNKGKWWETDKSSSYDKLAPEVKDGWQKTKYSAEWKVVETTIVYEPANKETYRLRVEKNDIQKKYLYFDKSGRLLRDAITL
jgi:hypothetical protein